MLVSWQARVAKGLGQPGKWHPGDTGPKQSRTLPPISPLLQKALRGDTNLILCDCSEIVTVLFRGLKQGWRSLEPAYLQGLDLCGVLPHMPIIRFSLSLLHIHTTEEEMLQMDPIREAPSKETLRPGLRGLK